MNGYVKGKDCFWVLLFVVFWLVPITYTGLTNKDLPFMSRTASYLQRIAYLFTFSVESWPVYYIQAKFEDCPHWVTLSEDEFFRLKPFGYRTRLHQLLYAAKDITGFKRGRMTAKARQRELAEWIAGRYREKYKGAPLIEGIRFVAAFYIPKTGQKVAGHWVKPPLTSFPEHLRYTISQHTIEENEL